MKTKTAQRIQTKFAAIEKRERQKLKNAFLDGQYILERPVVFFANRDSNDSLMGPMETFHTDTECRPERWTGKALLVSTQTGPDYDNRNWYAWIHA